MLEYVGKILKLQRHDREVVPLRRVLAFGLLIAMLGGCVRVDKPRQAPVPDGVAANALSAAMTVLGAPYVWGGQGPDVFDCSGLIIWAYQQVLPGLKLRIGSRVVEDTTQDELWRYNVLMIPPEQMKPGDIVFITDNEERISHGGLFIEWVDAEMTEFQFVNASSYYGEVVIDTWPLQGTKRGQWFVGAGRLLVVR